MKYIYILLFPIFFWQCSETIQDSQTIYDTSMTILLRNSNLENLLEPTTLNSYKSESIRIYSLSDTKEKKEIYNPNLDYPRNFKIYKYESKNLNENVLSFFPNLESSNNLQTTLTLIEWRIDDVDTIKCDVFRNNNSTIVQKIWYNSVLKYDKSNKDINNTTIPEVRFFEILK